MMSFNVSVDHTYNRSRTLVAEPPVNRNRAGPPSVSPSPTTTPSSPPVTLPQSPPTTIDMDMDARMRLLIAMVEYLSGKSIDRFNSAEFLSRQNISMQPGSSRPMTENNAMANSLTIINSAPVDSLDYAVKLQESERLDIHIESLVTLSNGAQYEVSLHESLSRALNINLKVNAAEAAVLIDPLIINLHGPLHMSDKTTEFDLNGDTIKESFSQLGKGSMYLALDINGDGKINDGSELFGAISGDGFAELSLYDTDKNGLIDRGDPIFQKLQLFRPGDGFQQDLADSEVVAIGLSQADTPFTFTDREGVVQAQIRSSGFYLTDDGRSGTVQQIDLAV